MVPRNEFLSFHLVRLFESLIQKIKRLRGSAPVLGG